MRGLQSWNAARTASTPHAPSSCLHSPRSRSLAAAVPGHRRHQQLIVSSPCFSACSPGAAHVRATPQAPRRHHRLHHPRRHHRRCSARTSTHDGPTRLRLVRRQRLCPPCRSACAGHRGIDWRGPDQERQPGRCCGWHPRRPPSKLLRASTPSRWRSRRPDNTQHTSTTQGKTAQLVSRWPAKPHSEQRQNKRERRPHGKRRRRRRRKRRKRRTETEAQHHHEHNTSLTFCFSARSCCIRWAAAAATAPPVRREP